MNRIVLTLASTGILLVLLGSLMLGCNKKGLEAMPVWELRDMDGNRISSQEFAGKVVIVDFWATWCPPCLQEIPGFINLQEKYKKDGLIVIGIALDELGAQSVKPFMKQRGINYLVLSGDTSIQLAFGGLDGLPTTFIFDRHGKLISKHAGYCEPSVFESEIAPFFGKR
ncbi:MAG TPA: TlpA disulfide reductase family protein [Verrucomicrobiae bacterium]|jgi:thiol-disulfide isomerase/thioredoxin